MLYKFNIMLVFQDRLTRASRCLSKSGLVFQDRLTRASRCLSKSGLVFQDRLTRASGVCPRVG